MTEPLMWGRMSGCDYCDEGLPRDAEGWHLRVDPEGVEGTQRIPCQGRDEQEAWTMVSKIAGLIDRAEAAEARVTELEAALTEIAEMTAAGEWIDEVEIIDIARAALAAPTKEGT